MLNDIGYLKEVLVYNGYKIGVVITYYKNYQKIGELFNKLSSEEKKVVLNNLRNYVDFLISKGLYPTDIWEDNVLVNLENLDVKIIDLDDYMTIAKSNIVNVVAIEKVVRDDYNELIKKLCKDGY